MNKNLAVKIRESLSSVLPIALLVLLLHFTLAPLPKYTLILFCFGTVLLIFGMGLFTLGADLAMMPMGERIGAKLTESRKLWLVVGICFVMGMLITIAEPDLQVLANQVPSVPDMVLILAVAFGVGIFLVAALLRIIFQKSLSVILICLYIFIFILATFTSPDYLAVAFDSGGVTTGPITVPFILALGIGVAAVRSGKSSYEDSFGLVALCSAGPILAVLVLGMFYDASFSGYGAEKTAEALSMADIGALFAEGFPHYAKEVLIALSPIILFFILFQVLFLRLPRTQLIKTGVGVAYTYAGLVLFLTGVNIGFMPAGTYIGSHIAAREDNWIIIPIGMVMGFLVVAAEPAVHVLNKQVEEISDGAISRRSMLLSLSLGVALSIGLAMIRVITRLSIWYFILPGYVIALGLTFFVPRIFTAIAFDSGGVASGPMTATFLLPLAMGACESLGGNILTDAFGIVAMVAMTPLVTIQLLGLYYKLKTKRAAPSEQAGSADDDAQIIEL